MTDFPATRADLLDAEVATLATIGADGYPQLTAIWFLHADGALKTSLNSSRLKTRNLTERPQCTFFLLDVKNPYRYLSVTGNARVEPDPDYAFAFELGQKYGGANLREHDGPGETRVVVTVEPIRVYPVDMSG